MKTCSKCNLELHLEQFNKEKKSKDGHKSWCKACEKKYCEENKEKISKRKKKYREENKDMIKKYKEENKEKICEYQKKYYEENKEVLSEKKKKYREENKEKIYEYQKKYCEENKEARNKYFKNRRKTDEGYRILCRLRARLIHALQGNSKASSTMELLGVPSIEFLIDYLEKTKVEGKDYSDAQIDHIRPCASFDLTDPEQQRECFHYTNLQWLTKEENMKKGAKW